MPVLAAMSMPTKVTERPRPPGKRPKTTEKLSRSFSATFDFSSTTPMKTNRGTAIMVWLVIVPKMRPERKPRSLGLKLPPIIPPKPKSRATPDRVRATG